LSFIFHPENFQVWKIFHIFYFSFFSFSFLFPPSLLPHVRIFFSRFFFTRTGSSEQGAAPVAPSPRRSLAAHTGAPPAPLPFPLPSPPSPASSPWPAHEAPTPAKATSHWEPHTSSFFFMGWPKWMHVTFLLQSSSSILSETNSNLWILRYFVFQLNSDFISNSNPKPFGLLPHPYISLGAPLSRIPMPISPQNQTLAATRLPPPSPLPVITATSILKPSLQIKPCADREKPRI
jgi:hypothetical protein